MVLGAGRKTVVAVSGGRSRVLVRRETEDDLLALDVDPTVTPEGEPA